MLWTRRDFGKAALAGLPLAAGVAASAQPRPNSTVRGVLIGMNVPYNFGGRTMPVDEIIQNCVQLGISGVEPGDGRARPRIHARTRE
jgi:hypothetical protein